MTQAATPGAIRKPTVRDISLMLTLAAVWASAFLVIKIVVPETGPLWLATMRVVIAFLVLLPLALYKGMVWPKNARQWRFITIIMSLNVVIPFFLISWAEQYIDAGVAALLMGMGPFMALIGSHFTSTDDRLSGIKILGAFFGFSGVLVLVGWDTVNGMAHNLLGQAATLGASACYVSSSLMLRHLEGYPPVRLSALVLGMGSISLLVISIYLVGLPTHGYSPESWLGMVYLGMFPSALGYILRYHLIQTVGVSVFSSSINLIPVFGVFMSALLLGEVLSPNVYIALGLIVTGLFIIRAGQGKSLSE